VLINFSARTIKAIIELPSIINAGYHCACLLASLKQNASGRHTDESCTAPAPEAFIYHHARIISNCL
jgi:hypothetical protein